MNVYNVVARVTLPEFELRAEPLRATRGATVPAISNRAACDCCGFPTLSQRGRYETCALCEWEEHPWSSDHPDQESSANSPLSLNEARQFFNTYLTKYRPNDRRGLVEFYPETREVRRLIARLYVELIANPGAAEGLRIAISYAFHALSSVRGVLTNRFPDFSEE